MTRIHLIESALFDNHPGDHAHIEVLPLAAAMGAEIRGIRAADASPVAFAELERALYRHKMIFLRAQDLSFAELESFTRRFGEFGEDAYTAGVPGHENVQPVVKEADTRRAMIFGTGWHTDSAFLERPPAISLLYAREAPPYGGDTIWANSGLAYRALSETMRVMIEPLDVRCTAEQVMAVAALARARHEGDSSNVRPLSDAEIEQRLRGALHPLVRTHPVTGERALYVDGTYARNIEGLTEAESDVLIDFLVNHITQSAFTCRLRWAPGTLTLWDNRLCLHQAYNDHDGFRREMYRTTVRGERPVRRT